jgi:hypothetical protein
MQAAALIAAKRKKLAAAAAGGEGGGTDQDEQGPAKKQRVDGCVKQYRCCWVIPWDIACTYMIVMTARDGDDSPVGPHAASERSMVVTAYVVMCLDVFGGGTEHEEQCVDGLCLVTHHRACKVTIH